jgi:hypothetical protein
MRWINKRLDSIQDNIIFGAIVAVGIGVWSMISNLPGPIIFVLVVVILAGVLVILNQIRTWRENRKKKFSQLSKQEIEDTIYKWVRIPFFDVKDKTSNKDIYFFQIGVTDPAKREVVISRNKDKPTQLELRSSVEALVGAEKTFLRHLEQVEQEQIILRLEMELARVGIGHDDIKFPLDKIVLVEIVSIDDLADEVHFRERIMFVLRAATLCQATTSHAWRGKLFQEVKFNVLQPPQTPPNNPSK